MAMQQSPDVGQPQPNVGSVDIERAISKLKVSMTDLNSQLVVLLQQILITKILGFLLQNPKILELEKSWDPGIL